MDVFIISSLPSLCWRHCKWQGPFAPQTLLRFIATTDPAATLVFGRLPGFAGYTAYPAPTISRRDEEGFSSCLACPCHRAVASTPPRRASVSVSLRLLMRPSPSG